MNSLKKAMLGLSFCILGLSTLSVRAESDSNSNSSDVWECSGYCFLGADTATDPFQPFGTYGATEQEARNNIPCAPYDQMGVVCRKTSESQKDSN